MCSLNDNDCNEEVIVLESKEINDIPDGMQCQKCNVSEASIKLRGKDVYCESCFQLNVTHKFRATLGKSKLVRPNDKVLVAHSGNCKSTTLLHLIKSAMHESVHKRLIFQTKVIYVDDGMINNECIDKRQSKINEIQQQIESMEFETFAASLSRSLDIKLEKINKIQDYLCSENYLNNKTIIELFNNLKSETCRDDLLNKLRLRVIVNAAKLLGCNKIFFADDSVSLSISILTNVSLGRGAQLSSDVGFINKLYGDDLLIMRPLRDFSRHEINHYINIHNLKIIHSINSLSNSNDCTSIRQLTERFITHLDSQFNGTISTIFRVSEKVSSVENSSIDPDEICILCNAPLDTFYSNDSTSAIGATAFSKFLSSGGTQNSDNNPVNHSRNSVVNDLHENSKINNCCVSCVENNCMTEEENDSLSLHDISLCLCYGCRLIFNDNYNYKLLPKFLKNSAKEQLCLKSMRNGITNFLL